MEEEVVSIQTIDIGKEILNTINALSSSLFNSINKTVLPELDRLVFMNDNVVKSDYIENIMGVDFQHGLLVIAEFLLCAFVVYYAFRRFTAFYSGKEVESPYQFFVKAVAIGIVASFSLNICSRYFIFNK